MTGVRGTGIRLSYRDYKLNLLAGVEQRLEVIGNYWQVIEAVGPVRLSFDESASIVRVAGTGGPAEYTRVTVSSSIDQAVVVTLGQTIGLTPYDRGNSTFAGTINVADAVPSVNASLPDLTVPAGMQVLVVAASATRRAVLVKLLTECDDGVRIGDSTTAADRGYQLETGDAAAVTGSPALYAFNPNAIDVVLSLLNQAIP